MGNLVILLSPQPPPTSKIFIIIVFLLLSKPHHHSQPISPPSLFGIRRPTVAALAASLPIFSFSLSFSLLYLQQDSLFISFISFMSCVFPASPRRSTAEEVSHCYFVGFSSFLKLYFSSSTPIPHFFLFLSGSVSPSRLLCFSGEFDDVRRRKKRRRPALTHAEEDLSIGEC